MPWQILERSDCWLPHRQPPDPARSRWDEPGPSTPSTGPHKPSSISRQLCRAGAAPLPPAPAAAPPPLPPPPLPRLRAARPPVDRGRGGGPAPLRAQGRAQAQPDRGGRVRPLPPCVLPGTARQARVYYIAYTAIGWGETAAQARCGPERRACGARARAA